jgi:outer membrane protein OmpA-like peptidoglycan-associated protein
MHKFGIIATSAFVLASHPSIAQERNDTVKTMIDQLVPKGAENPPNDGSGSVLTLQSVTKDEIVDRLSFSPSRSLESSPKPTKLPFVKGQESELLAALKGMPSMQVAVAFQGASDALAPEAGVLLSDLGQALASAKLANSRVMIGVHTNSVGSDEYNVDLSGLRAKAIVEILASVHGIPPDRLVPFGFGRTRDSTLPDAAADERIQVVNLGPVVQDTAPSRPETVAPTVVARPFVSAPPHPTVTQIPAAPVYVHYNRPPPPPPSYGYYDRPPHAYVRYATTPPVANPPSRHPQEAYKRRWSPQWADAPAAKPAPKPSYAPPPTPAMYGADTTGDMGPGPNNGGGFGYAPGGPGGNMGGGPMGGGNMGGAESNGPSGQHGSFYRLAGAQSNGPSGQHGSFYHLARGPMGGGPMGGGMMGGGMMGGGAGHGFFSRRSDRRLKRYIRRVGQSERGFILYSFQYIWGGPFFVGVMAQDLLSTYPEAVSVGPDNYLMVDYSKLDFDMMTLAEWEASSHRAAKRMAPAGL